MENTTTTHIYCNQNWGMVWYMRWRKIYVWFSISIYKQWTLTNVQCFADLSSFIPIHQKSNQPNFLLWKLHRMIDCLLFISSVSPDMNWHRLKRLCGVDPQSCHLFTFPSCTLEFCTPLVCHQYLFYFHTIKSLKLKLQNKSKLIGRC